MAIKYSPSVGGFFDTDVHGGNIPPDATDVTPERHAELLAAQAAGKLIKPGPDGLPIAQDPAPPTRAESVATRRVQILVDLQSIDERKIRALTDSLLGGDMTRLHVLEAQAVTLRAELAALLA